MRTGQAPDKLANGEVSLSDDLLVGEVIEEVEV